MPGPKESQRLLMEYIGEEGKSLRDIAKFAQDEELWFAPGEDILNVLIDQKIRGRLDYERRKFTLTRTPQTAAVGK